MTRTLDGTLTVQAPNVAGLPREGLTIASEHSSETETVLELRDFEEVDDRPLARALGWLQERKLPFALTTAEGFAKWDGSGELTLRPFTEEELRERTGRPRD